MSIKEHDKVTGRRRIDDTRQACGLPATFVLVLLASLYSVARGQSSDSLRVDQVIRDVISHNDRITAARYMEDAAKAKVAPAGAWDDPMLMLGVTNLPTSFDFTMDPMTMKMIGISQTIPYAGQKGLEAKAAGAEASAAQQDRFATEVDMAMAARSAFADLYYRTRSLADLTAQYELLQEVVASAKSKLVTNSASQDEVLGAQAEQWRLENQLLEADHMVDDARYNLNLLRGVDVNAQLPPLAAPNPGIPPNTPDGFLTAAKENFPPLRRLSYQAQSYAFSSSAARRMSWPMLNLQATYGFRTGSDLSMTTGMFESRDNMVGFQANISLPIFAGRQQKKMALSMDAMRRSVDAEAAQKWREVEARIRVLHTTALHLVQTIASYRDRIIPATQDAFQSALAGYATNRVPFTNVLMFASNVYQDRLALNQFSNQLVRTMAEIDSYTVDPKSYAGEPSERNQ